MYFNDEKLEKIKNEFDDISDLDAKIVVLKEDFWSYGNIQLFLGNPSKKYIRNVLLKYRPNLLTK